MLTAINLLTWPYPVDADSVAVCCVWFGKPISKGRPRFVRGRAITPPETRRYESELHTLFRAEMKLSQPDDASLFGLRCRFYRGDRLRADGDNLLKAVADAAQGAVFSSDAQVVEWHAQVFRGDKNPRVEVVIHRI